ncbi:MAG: pro-sigmaK processing inhibitor BofA family protein [Clostridium sp.]|uniref:pro-sigmaK processing inhibitor BofA family protein n=1 Tax=Clostridium sp. TaxID=1506 RepID=UPI002FCA90FD
MLSQLGELNTNMIMYIVIMAVLLSIAISIRIKNGIILKFSLRFLVAVAFIYATNHLSTFMGVDFAIPLNPITAGIAALLQAPGVALIYITKYAIFPA